MEETGPSMLNTRSRALELYTGLAVALLLLGSMTSGWIVVALALVLIVAGLMVFPAMRRPAVLAVIAAVLTAGLVIILRRS